MNMESHPPSNLGSFGNPPAPFGPGEFVPSMPYLFPEVDFRGLERDIGVLINLLCSITNRFFGGDMMEHARFLGLSAAERNLVRFFAKHEQTQALARPDCLLVDGRIQMLEANISSGIGNIGHADLIVQHFRSSPLVRPWLESGAVEMASPLEAYCSYLDGMPGPVAIVTADLDDDRERACDEFQASALRSRLEDVLTVGCQTATEELAGGSRRRLFDACASIIFEFSPYYYLENYRYLKVIERMLETRREVRVLCPLSSHLSENKLNLALISDPANRRKLSAEEREVVERCVPRTIRVSGSTEREIADHWKNYVLKKGGSRGFRHVLIGDCVSRDEFLEGLERASSEGNWVAQRKIRPPSISQFADDASAPRSGSFLTRVFWVDGAVAGVLAQVYKMEQNGTLHLPLGYNIMACERLSIARAEGGVSAD